MSQPVRDGVRRLAEWIDVVDDNLDCTRLEERRKPSAVSAALRGLLCDWRSDPNRFNESVIKEFRASGGVVGGGLADLPLLLLTTIDARSGQPRTTPLAYHGRGDRYLVIASNGGAARHPTWFRNLERDPNVTVEVGTETLAARARILDASERDTVFAGIVTQAPAAAAFQAKAGRTIPVIELEPLDRRAQ